MATNSAAVYKAIAAVMGDLAKTGISKAQTNTFDKYKFRGIDDVYNALAPLLSKHGLVVLPRVLERSSEERTSGQNKALFYVTVKAEFDFVAAEDGSCHTVCAYGEAMDRGDKGTNKAMTAAYKYAMFEAFCIPTAGSDDADAESHEVESKAAAPLTPEQAADLTALIDKTGTDAGKFCQFFKVQSIEQMRGSDYARAVKMLEKKQEQAA